MADPKKLARFGFWNKEIYGDLLAEDASKGINALEAVMLTWHAINSFRLLLKDDARIFGIITERGPLPILFLIGR